VRPAQAAGTRKRAFVGSAANLGEGSSCNTSCAR